MNLFVHAGLPTRAQMPPIPQQGTPLTMQPPRMTLPIVRRSPPDVTAPTAGTPGTAAPPAANQQQPAAPGGTLSSILAGLGISNVSPLQPTYAPNPTLVNPATMSPAQSNGPTSLSSGLINSLSPAASIQQILAGAQPVFGQQQRSLSDQLAAMGMFGGPALNATGALSQQQLASLGPTLANAIQSSQGMQLGAGEFGVTNALQQAMQNAQLRQQAGITNLGSLNQGNYFNAGNLNQQQYYNTQAYNAAQNNLWNSIMQAWQLPFNAYNNINLAGLQGAQGIASGGLANAGNLAGIMANTFPVQQPPDFSGLGQAIGSAFAQPPQAAPAPVIFT